MLNSMIFHIMDYYLTMYMPVNIIILVFLASKLYEHIIIKIKYTFYEYGT